MESKRTLKRRVKKLQHKLWAAERENEYLERDATLWRDICIDLEQEVEALQSAIKALRVAKSEPKMVAKAWLNGEPLEIKEAM